jgi:hypothetical protein
MKSDFPNNEEAERIDKEITQACEHGANECRRHPLHYWSVELYEIKRELSIYCQFRRRRKKGLASKALVARTGELGIRMSIYMSDGVIEDRINELKKKVKIIHEESKERREKYLLEQANISEDPDDKMKAKALRLMRLRERQGRAYSKFAYQWRGGSRGGGIKRLQVPEAWPTMDEYDDNKQYELEDPKKTSNWRDINCPKKF